MADPVIDHIVAKVNKRFEMIQPLIDRMDKDYRDGWRLSPFIPSAQEGVAREDAYTTNEPRVVAEKVIYGIAASERVIRVQNDAAWKDREDSNDNLERLAIGFLNLADKRLEEMGMPTVVDHMSSYAGLRGRYVVARALLMKNNNGDTVVDITPFDPRNFVMERGNGSIVWSCYRSMKTRTEIRAAYPDVKFDDAPTDPTVDDGWQLETVLDYYEYKDAMYTNAVIIKEQWAKPLTDTYAVKCPIIVRAVGAVPEMPTIPGETDEYIADFGESVFANNRRINRISNRTTSYHIAKVAYEVDRSYKVSSRGGNLSFTDNPMKKGSPVTLDVDNDEDIEPIDPPPLTGDSQMLSAVVERDRAAGGLSAQALSGQPPPGGMSAAALRLLGSNIGERTRPFLKPVESCILGCLEALVAQYETGGYKPVRVFGKTLSNAPFDREIAPENIFGHGNLSVQLLQQLPEDDNLKWATARLAVQKTGPEEESLLSMQTARERILGIQDSELESSRQHVQKGKTIAPVLALLEMQEAALRRGDQSMVEYLEKRIYFMQMQEFLEQQALMFQFMQSVQGPNGMMAAAQGMGGARRNGQAQPAQGGIPPQVASAEDLAPGTTGAAPSPTAGQNSTNPREPVLNAIGVTEQ